MKTVTLCIAALLLTCSLSARAADKREQGYTIGANVDAHGHVTATQLDPDVSAPIAAILATAVKQWQFVPAKLDGRPVPAHTFVRAKLQAVADAKGQYSVRIRFLGNGPRLDNKSRQPHYPQDAIRAREAAFTILEATAQPDGSLTDMVVSSKFEAWPLPRSFKLAVLEAARQWHVEPEQVDGQPVATHMRIPVNFNLNPPQFTMQEIKILREAARKETAAADAEASQPGIPLPSDEEVALDSPLHPSAVATITNAP